LDSQGNIDGTGILAIPMIFNNTSTRHSLLFRVILCQLVIRSLYIHNQALFHQFMAKELRLPLINFIISRKEGHGGAKQGVPQGITDL
jgi:hypothetical protein